MKTITINLKCKGDKDHPSHSSPIMMILLSDSTEDINKILSVEAALSTILPEKNMGQIDRSSEDVIKISDAIKLALVATGEEEEEEEEEEVFSSIKEVSTDVEFTG